MLSTIQLQQCVTQGMHQWLGQASLDEIKQVCVQGKASNSLAHLVEKQLIQRVITEIMSSLSIAQNPSLTYAEQLDWLKHTMQKHQGLRIQQQIETLRQRCVGMLNGHYCRDAIRQACTNQSLSPDIIWELQQVFTWLGAQASTKQIHKATYEEFAQDLAANLKDAEDQFVAGLKELETAFVKELNALLPANNEIGKLKKQQQEIAKLLQDTTNNLAPLLKKHEQLLKDKHQLEVSLKQQDANYKAYKTISNILLRFLDFVRIALFTSLVLIALFVAPLFFAPLVVDICMMILANTLIVAGLKAIERFAAGKDYQFKKKHEFYLAANQDELNKIQAQIAESPLPAISKALSDVQTKIKNEKGSMDAAHQSLLNSAQSLCDKGITLFDKKVLPTYKKEMQHEALELSQELAMQDDSLKQQAQQLFAFG